MALPYNVASQTIYRGDTFDFPGMRFREPSEDPDVVGEPRDLSDLTWRAQWRPNANAEAALDLEVDDFEADSGWLYVKAPAEVTAAMTGSGVWDLQGTDIDGVVETIARGKTKLTGDVTR